MNNLDISERHKLFWSSYDVSIIIKAFELDYIPVLDIGRILSEFIRSKKIDKYISFEVEEFIKSTVKDNAVDTGRGLKVIILSNPGILLESDLQLNPESILLDISRDTVLILHWNHIVENNKQFRWDDNSPITFTFPENSIKKLEL